MPKSVMGPEIERLVQLLAKLPGLGPRSARRAALHLVKRKEQLLEPLSQAMHTVAERVLTCEVCSNLDARSPCTICCDSSRDHSIAIVVESVSDLWALERSGASRGVYHVLGGVLSPLEGVGPEHLTIDSLVERVNEGALKEVIVAISATVEGQTTAHYLADVLKGSDISLTRLAHGVPVGGELEYLDEGTLTAAMRSRSALGDR